jgi:serine/threonine protein kinase
VAGPSDLQPGSEFATDFRVLRKLGEGGMGAVYEVEQKSTRRRRALKVLLPELLGKPGMEERFKTEAIVGAQIESEHVVEVIAAGTDPLPWLVMELLDGEDLDRFAARTGPLPRGAVREILDQLCHALGDAHRKGIVHRDLKPDNIFLAVPRRRGVAVTVKILDFGIAKILAEMPTSSRTSGPLGSPLWMAPEQADPESKPITPAADVWALGLIAFRLLTGRCYWKTPSIEGAPWMMLVNETLMLPLLPASARATEYDVADRLPPGFDPWFARCVVRDPHRRFPDATSAYAEIEHILDTGATATPARSPASPEPTPPPLSTTPVLDRDAPTLTFAVVSGSLSAESDLSEMCRELERTLSRPVRPRVLRSYAELKFEVEAGRVQIVWAPPLVAIDLEDAGLASIELCCTRGGQVCYFAAIFTRPASHLEKLEDLRGCHAAWVDADSSAGYLLPRLRLVAEGLDPDTLFGRESFLGTHAGVARAVLKGEADVGATYLLLDGATERPLSAGWLEAGAGINSAFLLATAGPIPSDAIVLSSRLPAELCAAITEQVKGLPSSVPDAVGRLLGADGFVPPRAAHFEALRALAGNAREGVTNQGRGR